MFDARRPMGWLFLLLPVLVALTVSAQTIPTTMIVDTVYRADGTPAGGTLLISWPEFTTAANGAVAAGNTGVTLGAGGALSVGLVSNANATPANTVYTVVYQLDDGSVKTEYWVVPTASPTTISAIRTTLGATSSASQMATQQYVNTALAGKANDAAVVHLAGTETIVGAKQFMVAPGLPTPVNPADAANKEYVDNSVQNGGSGSYVSTAGGTMTGPLTLSGDPVAPGQAATKNYVDLGTAGKADLIAGLVPSGEMGTGTANNTVCLHGDSTWGGCGSSSNAVSIQNVPVATTLPTSNQVMTYNASLGEYAPEAGGGVTAGMAAVKYATDFAWSQSPATNLGTAGPQTVNLAVCPAGVTGTEPWYYVYISATGTPEAVLVTGGTCVGNGQAGTLQFTTLNAHPSGYTIASASGGLQEALIVARFNPTNPAGPSQSGKVIVPPGELQAYARISVRASNVTVDFSGSIVDCYMNDTCILAGDPSNSTAFLDITLLNPRGRPMVVSGQNPFIEVNAQKTRLLNVTTRIPPTGGTFSSYVQVDNDQSFLLDGLDTSLATGSSDYGVLCNASVCNPVIYAPGPFSSNAAVGWLKNLNISMQCAGNGIDWQSGNTVKISDSVIQGFAQYGVRAGIQRGGYGGFELDNVYEEVGSCTNPAGAIGEAGVIAQGATVKVEGAMLPAGSVPLFTNTGSIDYRYYIVANSANYGASNPLYAGRALTNGSGNITITTPDVAGASTFDLLRVTYLAPNDPREQAPYGNGNYAVAISVNRSSACANGVCTFTDTQATLQAYTVATPAYFPLLEFWPGNLILAANVDSGSVLNAATAWVQSAPSDIVGVQGTGAPAVISTSCNALLGWTPLWLSCYTSMAPGTFYDQGALLMAVKPNNDGGLLTNLKGRLNFPTLGTGPGHIITLSDSNFQKTIATANNRPSNDANDAFIGYDQGNGNPATVGISLGAPVSISSYIGNVGDGTNWQERLTASHKEFKTNVQLDNTLTVAGTAQASSLLTTGAGSWAVEGSYGALSPALAGKSAIGFGTGGQLQVSENGGAVVGVAVLDSNGMVSENANTATQLAQTPTQCNGSFVTGVQANGNANCSVADVVELAETGAPNGIPNYGIFWFDSSCHCPKVISNNGQPVQLGLLNVFNLDANTLEEYNGASPQTLNIYGTRADASDYERMRLGYDTTDQYFFLGSDALGANDPQQGLGFWLQGSLRWVVDTSFNFKPWSDNVKDVGTPTLRLKHLYAGTYVDTTVGAVATDLPNATTTGTTLNKLAKVTGSPATAIIAATSDTGGMIGIVVDGAGTSGSAQIARGGQAPCVFDGATTAGDYVQISSAAAGDCHDSGASYPGIGQVLGRVLSTNASTGTYAMLVAGAEVQAPSAGNVNTVFGRAGTILAQAGDYSVGQVTGAAALASPALTGTPTAPTQAMGDNSTAIATDAWVKAQGYGTGGGISSGAQAEPYFNTDGSTGNATSPVYINAALEPGADMCAQIEAAGTAAAGGTVDASALTGKQVCSAANANAMFSTWTNGGTLILGSGILYAPLSLSNAGSASSCSSNCEPPAGTIVRPNHVIIRGKGAPTVPSGTAPNTTVAACRVVQVSNTSISESGTTVTVLGSFSGSNIVAGTNNVLIENSSVAGYNGIWSVTSSSSSQIQFTASSGISACSSHCGGSQLAPGQVTNSPVAGCTAPATREYPITSTTLVYSGSPDYRAYLKLVFPNTSGNLVWGKEPVRIEGSANLDNNGSWTVCELTQVVDGRIDPDCPANPSITAGVETAYVAVPSGLVGATIGSGTVGTITVSGGSPVIPPIVSGSSGTPNTISIKNGGQYPATFTPSCSNSGGSATCTAAIMTSCSASWCGVLHAEIPLLDDGPGPSANAFGQETDHFMIDCQATNDCVPYRSLYANEQSKLHHMTLLGSPERQLDYHTFLTQNAAAVDDVRMTAGSATCTVGTEGAFIGDGGPHGMRDVTIDMNGCSAPVNAGLRIETDQSPFHTLGGHAENALWEMLVGEGGPCGDCTSTGWGSGVALVLSTSDGPYQQFAQAAIKVSTNYQLASSGPATANYAFIGTKRSNSSGYTIADDLMSQYISAPVTTLYAYDSGQFVGTCSTCVSQLYGLAVGNGSLTAVSPTFTGTPTAPTPGNSDNSTKIATTAWVNNQGYGTASGNVSGPSSTASGDIATFNGITGKIIQDSGATVASLAPLASPTFTGTPLSVTPSTADNSTKIATTAYVQAQGYAPVASPTFTGTPTVPTATAGDNSTKIATTAYVRGEAQMAFTCPVAGAGALVQYCNWTLPAAITVTGFDLAAGTAPLTCSPYATLQVWDGTAGAEVGSYSITMTSGNNFYPQVTGSTDVPTGHLLRVKVTTAAAGCGTVAAGIVATITYQMQN